MSTETMVAILIVVLVAVAVAAWFMYRQQRSRKLRAKFGPEYDYLVNRERNPSRAEAILEKRERRVSRYNIRALTTDERDRFAAQWQIVQTNFVDDPRQAVFQADSLVHQALRAKGYPMADFENQAEDLSVDHPRVVDNYRAAHAIAMRDREAGVSTEDLRQAMQHYRNLFESVLTTNLEEARR